MQLNQNHYFLTSRSEISSIISPLKKYHINYFAYVKSYNDGSRILFTNRIDDMQAYFKRKHYLQDNCEAKPVLYQEQAVLWSTLNKQHLYKFSRDNFNIDHGMTLINPTADYCEFFAFASTPEHPEVINFYLNKLDIIKEFSEYFKETANPLIIKAEKHKINFSHHEEAIKIYSRQDLQDILIKSSPRKEKYGTVKISKRQAECISYLLAGETTREIANRLELSCRTVEHYINLLKAKFRAHNKTNLIIKLLAHKNH